MNLLIFLRNNDFASLTEILQQNNVEAISYSDISGLEKLKRDEISNIDEYGARRTKETFVSEFTRRKDVIVVNASD
jgi:hypothetical protein